MKSSLNVGLFPDFFKELFYRCLLNQAMGLIKARDASAKMEEKWKHRN